MLFSPAVVTAVTLVFAGLFLYLLSGAGSGSGTPFGQRLGKGILALIPLALFYVANWSVKPIEVDFETLAAKDAPFLDDWQFAELPSLKPVRMKEFRGKVVFLNFWATWCGPCVMEMPSIDALYARFRDRSDIALAIVATDDTVPPVLQLAGTKGYKFPLYYMNSSVPALIAPQVLPTTYIIDKAGRVRAFHAGSSDWNDPNVIAYLEQLAAETVPDVLSAPASKTGATP